MRARSTLCSCFNKTLPQCNIKFIFQSKNCLNNQSQFIDSILKEHLSHLVYKFLCRNCSIIVKLNATSFLDPENTWVCARKRINNSKKLVVKDHCLFFNQVGLLEDFSILTYESHPFKLLNKELLLVLRDKAIFRQTSKMNSPSVTLFLLYYNLLYHS